MNYYLFHYHLYCKIMFLEGSQYITLSSSSQIKVTNYRKKINKYQATLLMVKMNPDLKTASGWEGCEWSIYLMEGHSLSFSDCGDSYNRTCPYRNPANFIKLSQKIKLLQHEDCKVIHVNYVNVVPLLLKL